MGINYYLIVPVVCLFHTIGYIQFKSILLGKLIKQKMYKENLLNNFHLIVNKIC